MSGDKHDGKADIDQPGMMRCIVDRDAWRITAKLRVEP
jgi:hypothetical protein